MAREIINLKVELPRVQDLESFLGDLLGRRVTVRLGAKLPLGPKDRFVAAVYRTEAGAMAGVAALDLPLAVAFGASIAAMPPGVSAPILASGRFTDPVWENLYEVMNINSRWFQPQGGTMVAIDQLLAGDALTAEARGFLTAPQRRFEARVEVQGYGVGVMLLGS